jgi:phosphoribosylformimino-5-aminoimidazole carboxamide ribotide isomerase
MIRIIPAIDIIDGNCVRLSEGDFDSKKIYYKDPLDVARMFEDNGLKFLHMVDLDGARQKRVINYKVLERVAGSTSLLIDFGGGIQSDEDIHIAFDCGAQAITAGSIMIKNEQMALDWLSEFGADKIILGADVKEGSIAISGWQESSDLQLLPFLEKQQSYGFKSTICTDVSKDGMLKGPAFDLYKEIKEKLPDMFLIASGGISKIADVEQLNDQDVDGVIIGKAIYEGKIDFKDLQGFLTTP